MDRHTRDWPTMHRLIGRPVVVHLAEDEDTMLDNMSRITGILVDLTEDGEVVVDTVYGRRYGWPALSMEYQELP